MDNLNGSWMVIVSHSVVEVSCFPLWFDMLKASTIIPRQGMLSILCCRNSVGKSPLSFFFSEGGVGVYLVQSVNRSPTLWLKAWVNECMMLLDWHAMIVWFERCWLLSVVLRCLRFNITLTVQKHTHYLKQ